MADLEFYLGDSSKSWRVPLRPEKQTLGRMPSLADIVTPPEDNSISRVHAHVELRDGVLHVERCPSAKHPVFRILPSGELEPAEEFDLEPGGTFQIGKTVFRYCPAVERASAEDSSDGTLPPPTEVAYSPDKVREFRFVDANQRVEALSLLPRLIDAAQNPRLLEESVLETLLKGIPEAEMAAIVRLDPASTDETPKAHTLAMKTRTQGLQEAEYRLSRRLVNKAIRYVSPTHNVWTGVGDDPSFTVTAGVDWALCVPVDFTIDDLGIYVAGRIGGTMDEAGRERKYKGDVKFSQLTSDIYAALRRVIELQRQQKTLSRFLPRPVIAQLTARVDDFDKVLDAREVDVTALFCDLRGSCKLAAGEGSLASLLERLQEALGVMTERIVSRQGVIGDFQGDAAMAFWGWPLGDRQAERAAEAALAIQRRFREDAGRQGNSLEGMACGIGIAHGRGIAGRLGTPDQYKIGAFGPAVNLAARLESMTKFFRVAILVDSEFVKQLSPELPWARPRKLAKVRPVGFDRAVEVYELLSADTDQDGLPNHLLQRFDRAVTAFTAGRWEEARNLLAVLPESDGPSSVLKQYMADRHNSPPADWDGVIVLESK